MELENYIEEIRKEQLKEIDLSTYRLTEFPAALFEFEWLEVLIFGAYYNGLQDKSVGSNKSRILNIPNEITKLKHLKILSLSKFMSADPFVEIGNVQVLGEMSSLEELYLQGNKLTNLDFLKDLKQLRHLGIDKTGIEDFVALKDCNALEWLDIGQNNIENLDFLSSLTNLKGLCLAESRIKTLDALKNIPQLEWLCVCENDISDFESLKGLKALKYYCPNSPQEIEYLVDCISLNEIQPRTLNQAQLNLLGRFKNLEYIYVWNFEGTSIDLSPLINAKEIQIHGDFEFVNGFEKLEQLEEINLHSSKLKSLSIPHLEKLRKIDIRECAIDHLDFYKCWKSIIELNIAVTKIDNLEALKGAHSLKHLCIAQAPIKSLRPILDLLDAGLAINSLDGTNLPVALVEEFDPENNQLVRKYYPN